MAVKKKLFSSDGSGTDNRDPGVSHRYRRRGQGPLIERFSFGSDRTSMETSTPSSTSFSDIDYDDMAFRLSGSDPKAVDAAIWELYDFAKSGGNIEPLFSVLYRSRETGCSSISKSRLMDAIGYAAENGQDITDASDSLKFALESESGNIKSSALLAILKYARAGEDTDISAFIENLVSLLRDSFAINRSNAAEALKTQASKGEEHATKVWFYLRNFDTPQLGENLENFPIKGLILHCKKILDHD